MPPVIADPNNVAFVWFACLLLVCFGYVLVQIKRSPYSHWENCLYLPTYLMGRLRWRVNFTNAAPPALQAGGILVANHRSSVDPFFVQLAARRRVHWMVAKEYCVHALFGPILKLAQVIPTNRSGMDTASTKAAIRITRENRLVGMFPEGRINMTDKPLLPIRGGAALVAARAGVPIIPLYIHGSPYRRTVWSPLLMHARVTITFGTPLWPKQFAATATNDEAPTAAHDRDAGNDNEPPVDKNSGKDGQSAESVDTDAFILSWGQQIVELAGRPATAVELASARRRRQRS